MEATEVMPKKLKLNYRRTILIGFAYFSILLIWQIYDYWCPEFLTELFYEAIPGNSKEDVQYLVGIMMSLDNLVALIMLPLFGRLSDKTHTRIGKRMPYILIGTFLCALIFPFIPIFFHYHNLIGVLVTMGITIIFATINRNPIVSLMPDMTPKPLRSKANGIINIMSYIGVVISIILSTYFSLSEYHESWIKGVGCGNIWIIEAPFLFTSVFMMLSALVLFFRIDENKITNEMNEDVVEIEEVAKATGPNNELIGKENRIILWTILIAEFLWFMSENGINTFITNYTLYYLLSKHSSSLINIVIGSLGGILGFAIGVVIANKIGCKWAIFSGLAITFLSLLIWLILSLAIPIGEANPDIGIYNKFPIYLYFIWFLKGFGMSVVNVNAFPMCVELCSNKKIGQFTGYYFASSMAAQTITPIVLGSLLLIPSFTFKLLPLYSLILIGISLVLFLFLKDTNKSK